MTEPDAMTQAEARRPPPPIPFTVLTGFLGAGKTTLLNRLLAEEGSQQARTRALADALQLPDDQLETLRIECFDISHTAGESTQASCVVFEDHKMQNSQYRRYKIEGITPGDDYAAMDQALRRRYARIKKGEAPLPDLLLIDGGKGQLSHALEALESIGLRGKIAIIGIAKRLEELFYPDDPIPLYLDKKTETLKIIQQLRNEAHRFGITFHRNKRSKEV